MKSISKMRNPTWEELLGSNNWEAILTDDGIDHHLRDLIFRCGDLSQATYDAFFTSTTTTTATNNDGFGPADFFREVSLRHASRYRLAAFLYATASRKEAACRCFPTAAVGCCEVLGGSPWGCCSNWMGYVAVTTDEASRESGCREIYVAWRGTKTWLEWYMNVFGALPSASLALLLPPGGRRDCSAARVHAGWLSMYTSANPKSRRGSKSARSQLRKVLDSLINDKYLGEKISVVVTGHSLGGALATLSAFDIVENSIVGSHIPVAAILFCSPKVGNLAFKKRLRAHPNLKILHVRNRGDLVPRLPLDFGLKMYVPAETRTLVVRSDDSPCLKRACRRDLGSKHCLEVTLHAVAGWDGNGAEFDGESARMRRSLALVNKWSGYLRSKYSVPECWWPAKSSGMVLLDESTGHWALGTLPPPQKRSFTGGFNKVAPVFTEFDP